MDLNTELIFNKLVTIDARIDTLIEKITDMCDNLEHQNKRLNEVENKVEKIVFAKQANFIR